MAGTMKIFCIKKKNSHRKNNLLFLSCNMAAVQNLFCILSPGQTIATCQRNISQHCWAQHVACVWPPRVATCCDVLGVVGSNLTIFKPEPTTPNMSQHIATRWPNARNMLRPTMLRYVALACCDRLAGALRLNSSVN